jgi:NADH-quinone oxidoreductase subunit H
MKFSMFFIAEYANMLTAAALLVTLFFGGWDVFPGLAFSAPPWTVTKTIVTFFAFWAKTLFFYLLYIWIRWTLPRFRFDQLMDLGWKFMLPLALAYVMVTAVAAWALVASGVGLGHKGALALIAMNVVLGAVLFLWLDRGRIVSGAGMRARSELRADTVSHMGGD